jgi:hypothetical protein
MIGSPASRGAVASVKGASRACLAAAPAVSPVSTASTASVTMAGARLRRIAVLDRAVGDRFTMPFAALMSDYEPTISLCPPINLLHLRIVGEIGGGAGQYAT